MASQPPPPERTALLQALRQIMKTRKVTVAELAKRLGVSAQTLKRLFNGTGDCALERVVAICAALGVNFYDVVELAKEPREEQFQLTVEQEEAFVAEPHVHEFFYRLRDDEQPEDIAKQHGLSNRALQRYLKRLEELGLIERLPGNRCKVLVRGAHNFIKDGPLVRRYVRRDINLMLDFLDDPANRSDRTLMTSTATHVSPTTALELCQDLRELAARYRSRAQRDCTILAEKDTVPVRWLMTVATGFSLPPMEKIIEI
jgi:DNA-binding MarR family transcriptional regulator